MNQSEILAITYNLLKAVEKLVRYFKPITKQVQAITKLILTLIWKVFRCIEKLTLVFEMNLCTTLVTCLLTT